MGRGGNASEPRLDCGCSDAILEAGAGDVADLSRFLDLGAAGGLEGLGLSHELLALYTHTQFEDN